MLKRRSWRVTRLLGSKTAQYDDCSSAFSIINSRRRTFR